MLFAVFSFIHLSPYVWLGMEVHEIPGRGVAIQYQNVETRSHAFVAQITPASGERRENHNYDAASGPVFFAPQQRRMQSLY